MEYFFMDSEFIRGFEIDSKVEHTKEREGEGERGKRERVKIKYIFCYL